MRSLIFKILAMLILPTATTSSFAQNSSSVYTCEAFARMSGASLPRTMPCKDGNMLYKSFNLYCEAKTFQDDIRRLGGCNKKYFDKQRSIYGQ